MLWIWVNMSKNRGNPRYSEALNAGFLRSSALYFSVVDYPISFCIRLHKVL